MEIYFLLQRPNLPQYYYYEIQPIPGISEVGVCMKNKPARHNLENHLRGVYSREKVSEKRMFHQRHQLLHSLNVSVITQKPCWKPERVVKLCVVGPDITWTHPMMFGSFPTPKIH